MKTTLAALPLLLTLTGPTVAQAAERSVAAKVKSFEKYFSHGKDAVEAGAVVPHAELQNAGAQARAIAGIEVTTGAGKVTVKGMETPVTTVNVGVSVGSDLGAGPIYRNIKVIGQRGMNADEVVPTRTENASASIFVGGGMLMAKGSGGQRVSGFEVGPRIGAAGEWSGTKTFLGASHEGPMLQRFQEGKALAGQARTALDEGRTSEASGLLYRMSFLREGISTEKQGVNRTVQDLNREDRAQKDAVEKAAAARAGTPAE